MNKITFSNKTHGKLDFTMADFIAWKAYISDEKLPPREDKIINLHPQADQIIEPKKGRGRPKKIIFQPAIIIPEPEPIHQHPAPVFTSKGSDQGEPEPEPQLKRRVGRPRKILFIGHGC